MLKRLKRILIVFLSVITLLLLFLNLFLNFPSVQTWLTHRAASFLSAKLHAKVQVGRVDFEFLKKLVLKDVYIQDLRQDTLLYAEKIKADIGGIDFKQHILQVSDLILDNARFKVITYKNEEYVNLQFILDFFASKDTTKNKPPGPKWDAKVGALTLDNIYFSFRNEHMPSSDSLKNGCFNPGDMKIHDIHGQFNDLQFEGDTLRAFVESLAAKDESGLTLKNLTCYVKLSSKKMELDAMTLETPKSVLSTDLIFTYSRFGDFFDFLYKVNMNAKFNESTLSFEDLALFSPDIKGIHNTFIISGEYAGTINHLIGHDMKIRWGKFSSFEGDAYLSGLPDIMKTTIDVDVDRLVSNKSEIELLPRPPFDKVDHIVLPDNFSCLKTMQLSGSFKGHVYDFRANGSLSTGIGKIFAVLNLKQDTTNNDKAYYKGSIGTEGFDLGTFWGSKDLGTVTSSVTIEGKGLRRDNADAQLTGDIGSFTFKKYKYNNLALSGELRKGFFSGLLEVNDPNLQIDFNGNIDIASNIHSYEINTYITKANLDKLNLVHDTVGPLLLSTHVQLELKGNDLDDMDGSIHVDSTKFAYHKDNYHLKYLDLKSVHKGDVHTLALTSDYANATLSGYFPLTKISDCMQNMLAPYFPSLFSLEKRLRRTKPEYHDYFLNIHFNENTGLTNLFIPTLKISQGSEIKASYKETNNEVTMSGDMALVEWAGKKIKRIHLAASGNESKLNINTTCDTLFLSDSLYAAALTVKSTASHDTTHYTIKWNNDSGNYADIPGIIAFPNKTDIIFKFINPIIDLRDSIWQADSKNVAIIDTSGITAKSLGFYHLAQSITLQGKLSHQKNDAMVAIFKNLNLQDFDIGTTTTLKGTVDGTASIANIYAQHPFFAGSLNFNNLILNKQSLGDGTLNCYWDNAAQAIALNGQLASPDTKYVSFVGAYYDRDSNNLHIDATLQGMPAKIFQPYLKDYTSDFDGSVSGNAQVNGNLNRPLFSGDLTANVKKFKFDYLNTYYHADAINVAVTPDTFRIKPSVVLDDRRDTAIASGTIIHNHFKNFKLNLSIDARDFMCLNTTEANNNLYYGKGFASGNLQIYGPLSNIHIDAGITTEKGTAFNIPLSSATEVDESDIIRFVNKKEHTQKKQVAKVDMGGLEIHLTVKVTPDATARLIFAEKIGDVMQGTGSGTLQMDMNTLGDFSIRGQYTVVDGIYDFTLKNTFSKKFGIENGGTINWTGDPYNADIDLNAIYKLRTSLSPLFPDDSTGVYKKPFPVNCAMELTGKLTSPDIKPGVELPTVDEGTRSIVNGYLSSSNELYRQFMSLLLIKSFVPVQEGAGGNSPNIGQGIGINSSEFLSDQLSNVLSSINSKVNIGINYQPGTTPNSQELQLMFSTQLLNDRLALSGDAGTLGAAGGPAVSNTNNVVGEITAEYKLSKDGKVRVKAFNKANDNTTVLLQNAPYTQGGGLTYKTGFNTWGELWQKLFKRKPKKEQNTTTTK